MPTAQVLINAALVWLNELEDAETPNASESTVALGKLNRIIDNWSIQDTMATQATILSANLTVGVNSVALGTRVSKVVSASVATSAGGPTWPLKPLTAQEWNQIEDKDSQSNKLESFFYDRGFPTGTVYVAPVPASSQMSLTMVGWPTQSAFSDLTTPVTLLPGYEQAIVTALAMDLAPNYSVESSKELLAAYTTAMAEIQRLNSSLWGEAAAAAA